MASPLVASIDPERCDRSPFCPAARTCPAGAIRPAAPSGLPRAFVTLTVDASQCTGCGRCVRICPHQAISIVPRTGVAGAGTAVQGR